MYCLHIILYVLKGGGILFRAEKFTFQTINSTATVVASESDEVWGNGLKTWVVVHIR